MGYCIDVTINNVFVPSDKIADCLKAINDLTIGKNHTWVNAPKEPFADLKMALAEWRYETHMNSDGNLQFLYFTGEKLGDDEILFKTLTPYLNSDGNIQFQGEDGASWRYIFENGQFEEQFGRMVWE